MKVSSGEKLPTVLKKIKFSSIAWTHDNKGFFYQVKQERRTHLCMLTYLLPNSAAKGYVLYRVTTASEGWCDCVLCVLVFWQCSAIPKLVTVLMEQKQIRIRTTRSVVQ